MKLELRRKQELNGKIFYQVWVDNTIQEAFYAGIVQDPMAPTNEQQAKRLAQVVFDRIKENAGEKIEVIQSEEI